MRQFFVTSDPAGLYACLESLSSSEQKTAGHLLSENLLPENYPQFWTFFSYLVPRHPKAYLGTFLKAACEGYRRGQIDFGVEAFRQFGHTQATPIDSKKTLDALLPLLRTPQEVDAVMRDFSRETHAAQAGRLVRSGTAPCYYRLLMLLKHVEDDAGLLRSVCLGLIRKNDSRSFNMACIVCRYFGLTDLPVRFSLKLEDYEISRLDDSYEKFIKTLGG